MKKMIRNNSVAGLLFSSDAIILHKINSILPFSSKGTISAFLYRIITSLSGHIYINADFLINNKKVFSTIQLPK